MNRDRWAKLWNDYGRRAARSFDGKPMGDLRSHWVHRWFRAMKKAEAAECGSVGAYYDLPKEIRERFKLAS